MVNRVSNQQLIPSNEIKELSKKIETLFLTELLKVMLTDTFLRDKTTSTYMAVIIPELAEMISERDIGIGRFLTENPNFINSISENKKISLPVNGKITSMFGLRIDPIDGKLRHHNGIDIAVPEGSQIKPVLPGKVIYSGYSAGYGNYIIIEHEGSIQTIYAHNSRNLVKAGDMVTKNTVIAFSGSTGRATGPHLHFEVWKNGKAIDPYAMINNFEKSTILYK